MKALRCEVGAVAANAVAAESVLLPCRVDTALSSRLAAIENGFPLAPGIPTRPHSAPLGARHRGRWLHLGLRIVATARGTWRDEPVSVSFEKQLLSVPLQSPPQVVK